MSVTEKDGFYYLATENTCYVVKTGKDGAEHVYYGPKIRFADARASVRERKVPFVNALYYADDKTASFDCVKSEYSVPFRGDSRAHAACFTRDGQSVFDFVFESARIGDVPPRGDMPLPRGEYGSLCLTLRDRSGGAILELWYLVFEKSDAIVRFTRVVNGGKGPLRISALASVQLDMPAGERVLTLFGGAWSREFALHKTPLKFGRMTAGSYSGMSSAECNPFFMLEENDRAYGFNLMYSGSHSISAEISHTGLLRVMSGIQPEGLDLSVAEGEALSSPCAVLTCAEDADGVSRNMHAFVMGHVAREQTVPVMLNTWEAMYFDLGESRLLALADEAERLGFECLVIDDGWFGGRRDDTSSLGDWFENRDLFPSGIAALSDRLAEKGMSLGIWIEPEMISKNSDLYRAHPDWALRTEGARDIEGRNQYVLDMTRSDVREYVLDRLGYLVRELGAKYIKWDFNRRFADVKGGEGSGYFYRYYAGLYSVLERFTAEDPDAVIENCASGGGRFDLGMFSYTAAGWPSDNTDALSRAEIQYGASFGYPPKITLSHVAAVPSHQTKRTSDFSSRINTALIGAFGVQADIAVMSAEEKEELKRAIARYKKTRGSFVMTYRPRTDDNLVVMQFMNGDASKGALYMMQKRLYPSSELPAPVLCGLDENARYRVSGDGVDITAGGAALMKAGLALPQAYHGDKFAPGMIMLKDGGTMLLDIEKIEEER